MTIKSWFDLSLLPTWHSQHIHSKIYMLQFRSKKLKSHFFIQFNGFLIEGNVWQWILPLISNFCHTLVIITKKDSTTISCWLDISLFLLSHPYQNTYVENQVKTWCQKKACFHKVYSLSNTRKLMTRNALIGTQFCHTLHIIIKND